MFDDTATYLILTGQIMWGNGLYMIVVPGDNTGILGKGETWVNTILMCVYMCVSLLL